MDIDGESFAKINVSSYKTGFDNKNKEEVVRDIELAYDTAMAYKELYENLNTSYAELEEKFHSRGRKPVSLDPTILDVRKLDVALSKYHFAQ